MAVAVAKKVAHKPGLPMLRSTKANPYPSAPQATKAVMSAGGPRLATQKAKKTTGRVGPGTGGNAPPKGIDRGPSGTWKILRSRRMARRVGVPKTALRGAKVTSRITKARKNLAGPKAGRTVTRGKHGARIVKTAGRTKIVGKGRTIVVTKQGSVIRNKKANTVTRSTGVGTGRSKVVKRYGVGTKTKADDARAVKVRGRNRARLSYTGPGGRTTTVSRRQAAPRKIKVRVTGPGGKTRSVRVIGPKQTTTTRGGKTTTSKTRYISKERRENVTPKVGEKGWAKGNTRAKKKAAGGNVPKNPHKNKPKNLGKGPGTGKVVRGNWKNVRRFRRLRRRQGARFNQSVTKGQLKAVTSRRLS